LENVKKRIKFGAQGTDDIKAKSWLITKVVTCGSLTQHPKRNTGNRAIGLGNHGHPGSVAIKLAADKDRLTASRMKRIINPRFDDVLSGSMSLFRAELG
jgi:hypothetical protein